MENSKLLDLLREQIATGVSRDEIKKILISHGWNEREIVNAFEEFDNVHESSTVTGKNKIISSGRQSKSLKILIVLSVFVVLIATGIVYALGVPQSFFQISENGFKPSDSIDAVNFTTYFKYCDKGTTPPVSQVVVGMDVRNASFDKVKKLVETAISRNEDEKVGLLYLELSQLLSEHKENRTAQELSSDLTQEQLSLLTEQLKVRLLEVRERWIKEISKLNDPSMLPYELFEKLQSGEIENLGLVLGVAGYREIIDGGNYNLGLDFLKCAAENYNDDLAMHTLGQIYRLGVLQQRYHQFKKEWEELSAKEPQTTESIAKHQEIEARYPKIVKSPTPLRIDNKQSLFWALVAQQLDPIKHNVFTDGTVSAGWKNIATIDAIVEANLLTDQEMEQIECEVGSFLVVRYPDLPKALGMSICESH